MQSHGDGSLLLWMKILFSQKSPGLEENLRRFRSVWSCQVWGEVPLPVQSWEYLSHNDRDVQIRHG